MIYLSSFSFPSEDSEWKYRMSVKRTCYSTLYPFYVLPNAGLEQLVFAPITILYGSNGCGKSTALNVIAEKLGLLRSAAYNRSNFFEDYVGLCAYSLEEPIPPESRILTSDDVFDFMLDLRSLNAGVDRRREDLFDEYAQLKRSGAFQLRSMEDYDHLRNVRDARRLTQSEFTRRRLPGAAQGHSNGESAEMYFRSHIKDDTLCLLDEPENSLSPEKQITLAEYLVESARYCGCQLIVSTHSPFLLAMEGAKIYDLDHRSQVAEKWTDLQNPRVYHRFFEAHRTEFEN